MQETDQSTPAEPAAGAEEMGEQVSDTIREDILNAVVFDWLPGWPRRG
jgi:hypothetical protein